MTRLLEDPQAAVALRALPAPALRQVILRIGLEDAGELIALSSLDQLREVFDEDLWPSAAPGEDEAFDAPRFVTWLEVLLEGGDAFVADRLAELSEDFLVFAVSQLVRVLDVAVLTAWASDPNEAELLEQVMDTHLCQELDSYLLVSRTERGWDAVLAVLLALDERHSELLRGVLERCAAASHEQLGSARKLRSALQGDDVLLEDARAERDTRRSERGYVSPADARAFLALARTAPEQPELDPITRAYFRELEPVEEASRGAPSAGAFRRPPPLRQLLAEAGFDGETPEAPPAADSLFRELLAELADQDPGAHQHLVAQLAYLANVLVAGDASAGRTWRSVEAAERVVELCDEGLRRVTEAAGPAAARDALLRWGAVDLFRVAWASR